MSTDPTDVVRAFYELVWGARRLELLPDIIDEACTTHQLRSGGAPMTMTRGPAAMRHHISEWFEALPDASMQCHILLAQGDNVASMATLSGTHRGKWYGIAPTGKTLSFEMMVIHRVAAGKIVEDWVLVEAYGAFETLGLVPSRQELVANAVGA